MTFDHITVSDGLTQSTVTTIHRDSRDFMWFGTYDGLNLYDGIVIKKFESISNDPTTLSGGNVTIIYEDIDKNLWVGTETGLSLFNYEKEVFKRFLHDRALPGSLPDNLILGISEDTEGRLWVVTSLGVSLYQHTSGDFINFPVPREDENNKNDIDASFTLNSDTIYILSGNKILQFITGSLKYNEIIQDIPDGEVNTLLVTPQHDIWMGTENNGSFKIQNDQTILHFYPGDKYNSNLGSVSIKTINTDRKGNIWLSTRNGLHRLNQDGKSFIRFQYENGNNKSLLSSYVRFFYEDHQGIIWVGSVGGVNRFNPERLFFRNFNTSSQRGDQEANTSGSEDNLIWCFNNDRKDNLWVGSMRIPLSYIPKDQLGAKPFTTAQFCTDGKRITPPFNSVLDIETDNKGNLWLGTEFGLHYYNPINGEIKGYFHLPDDSNSLCDNFISSIVLYGDSLLWLGTGNGLCMFDLRTSRFTNFYHSDSDTTSLVNNYIYSLFHEGDEKLWIATIEGLSCLSLTKGCLPCDGRTQFRNLKAGRSLNSKSFNEVFAVVKTSVDHYWLCTNNGIFRIDSALNLLERFSVEEGLPNKTANQILEDKKGQLWISTENGLSCFNPSTRIFRNFDTNDGLPSNEFNTTASYKDKYGSFYLGGINGFTVFNPDSANVSGFSPKVVITGIELFNNPVEIDKPVHGFTLSKSIYETTEVTFNYKQNFFTLSFASLDYRNPERIIYEYKMEGLDQEWVLCKNDHLAHYTDVKPGKYTFMVRATNSEGAWSDNMAMLHIIVSPPFWKTTLFYILVGLLIGLTVYFVYRLRIISLERDKMVLEDEVQRRTNEINKMNLELKEHRANLEALVLERTTDLIAARDRAEKADKLKTAFLSNISHEVRTPMNSIMGFSNLLKEHSYDPSQINEYLEYITDGAQNLLNIVTNIVEISKISANDVTVSIKKFNFTRLINDIYSRFYSKAKMNGLDYTLEYNSSYNDLWIVADDGKLSSAISHLLDNALKFTNEGSIKLSFTIKADQLEVCVQDTGIGIAPEMKDDIFESFKQADVTLSRAYGGTGLGLSITKAYIEKMGGQIRFDSVQGKGSTFCISFPFTISSEKASEDFNIASISEELNILVVEDEEMNYFYLREILKNRCKNIYHARDGYSAIEYCKNNPTINMVLMDIKLPGINGLEATIEIKKIRPDLPVIAQTAYTLVGDREKALSAGCNDYISKPINREKLYSIMNSFVKEQNL